MKVIKADSYLSKHFNMFRCQAIIAYVRMYQADTFYVFHHTQDLTM